MFDIFGPCIRTIPVVAQKKVIYLTFDDGPDPVLTPKVLTLLERYQATATFFMIADRAASNTEIVKEVQDAGHSIGNHSLDHNTRYFFSSFEVMSDWILRSEAVFKESLGITPVGFRSPAGVQTPTLHRVLKSLDLPMVHWSKRFFDSTFRWSSDKALRSLEHTQPGQIVLLHDLQKTKHVDHFLSTLELYLEKAQSLGISFRAITSEDISRCLK